MTCAQAATWGCGQDGRQELLAYRHADQRTESLVSELGFDVQHEPHEQLLILFWLDEETHCF